MSINSIYTQEEQAKIRAEIRRLQIEYERHNIPRISRRYFVGLAEKYKLVEKLEEEVDKYKREESGSDSPTSDLEIAKFFGVCHFSVQVFLSRRMNSGKRNIKAQACLEIGRENGWPHLRDSGKIPSLDGRVRDAAIRAVKKKWGKT